MNITSILLKRECTNFSSDNKRTKNQLMHLFLKNYIDDDDNDDDNDNDCKILRICQTSEIIITKERYKRSLSCKYYNVHAIPAS